MIKKAYSMQINSANRKSTMKKLPIEYQQKYATPQNVLSIKFVPYNFEAAVAFDADYKMTLKINRETTK